MFLPHKGHFCWKLHSKDIYTFYLKHQHLKHLPPFIWNQVLVKGGSFFLSTGPPRLVYKMRFLNILNQEVIQNGIIDFKKSRWFCPIGWILPSGRVYRESLLATGLFCLFPPNITIFVSNMTMLAKIWP